MRVFPKTSDLVFNLTFSDVFAALAASSHNYAIYSPQVK